MTPATVDVALPACLLPPPPPLPQLQEKARLASSADHLQQVPQPLAAAANGEQAAQPEGSPPRAPQPQWPEERGWEGVSLPQQAEQAEPEESGQDELEDLLQVLGIS